MTTRNLKQVLIKRCILNYLKINFKLSNNLKFIVKDRFDNTIVRFYYTKQLRKYELGLMGLGTDPASEPLHIIIPPQAEEIMYTSFCYSDCTEVDLFILLY